MNNRTVAKALFAVAIATAAVALIAAVLILNPGYGSTPMTAAPTVSTAPDHTSTPLPAESIKDIDGLPTHITVVHDDATIIDAPIVPITINNDGVLAPPSTKAGVYYSPEDWNTIPGNLDRYRGIIAGHDVTGTGAKDVFYDLGEVTKGDRIILTYELNSGDRTTAEFTATTDATSVAKADVIHADEYQYLWQPMNEAGRYLSLFSCDLREAIPGQHSRNNWIVNATRIN